MNRCVWAMAVLSACVLAEPASGGLIRYTVELTPGPYSHGDPLGLAGSLFHLEYVWDAATLTPTFDAPFGGNLRATVWPNTNTTVSLTITGSTSADGAYAGASEFGWLLRDNGDSVQIPNTTFGLPGHDLHVSGLLAFFPDTFNTPAPPGTVFPFPFEASDVSRWQNSVTRYISISSFSDTLGQNITGSAELLQAEVPEPSSLVCLGMTLLAALGTFSRRLKVFGQNRLAPGARS